MNFFVIELFLLTLFGAIIGSFLNVVILRHNTGKSLAGRSGCMMCNAQLQWFELVPIISYVCQVGRCTTCRGKISRQYPIVEVVTAGLFALVWWFARIHTIPYSVVPLLLVAMAIVVILAVYDYRHMILPDVYVWSFVALSVVAVYLVHPSIYQLGWQLIGGVVTALPIFALW